MDKISIETLKCSKHPNKQLQFIQVNELLTSPNQQKSLFYCSSCFNHDLSFQATNYLMIDQIFSQAHNSIIPKWPPVIDYQIIQDLFDFTQNQSQMIDYKNQITDFFDQLKREFSDKIDIIQKKIINEAQKYPTDSQQTLKKYQEISKILDFKQLLTNQQQRNLQDHSQACRQFIQQIESQKDQNTEKLKNLLSETQKFQTDFNLEYPNLIKQNIFTFLDQISFFNLDTDVRFVIQQNNNLSIMKDSQDNQSNKRGQKITADLIMRLVANKSNFCSDEFINELDKILKRVNPILELSRVDTISQENKKAIEFEKISEKNLKQIEEYINHQIFLRSDLQYENEVKNSLEMKSIQSIIKSKKNFLNTEFIEQFERSLLEIQPFLKQINFTNIFTDQNKQNLLLSFSDEQVNDFKTIAQDKLFIQSIKLIATKYENGQSDLSIIYREQGEYEIEKLNDNHNWANCISSLNLEKDMKYVFRLKPEQINEGEDFMIGLMRYANADLNVGYVEYLSCFLRNKNNNFQKVSNWGIQNQQKGNEEFQISTEKIIELRVCLKEQILEILDYPGYEYKLVLDDKYKQKLTQYDDLRFYIGMWSQGNKIILKDAEIVEEFIN